MLKPNGALNKPHGFALGFRGISKSAANGKGPPLKKKTLNPKSLARCLSMCRSELNTKKP